MGITGTGHLSDYSNAGSKTGSGGQSGGSSGADICEKEIVEQLEEVARSEFYIARKAVPNIGTNVVVMRKGRITVSTTDGIDIGFLPTQYNYLVSCLEKGYKYDGEVTHSADKPIPSVLVALTANHS